MLFWCWLFTDPLPATQNIRSPATLCFVTQLVILCGAHIPCRDVRNLLSSLRLWTLSAGEPGVLLHSPDAQRLCGGREACPCPGFLMCAADPAWLPLDILNAEEPSLSGFFQHIRDEAHGLASCVSLLSQETESSSGCQ